MTPHEIQLLYEYDRWANNRVLQAASALTNEQFTRDLGGGHRSLRHTLVHMISGEWVWLAYLHEPSPGSAFVEDLRKRRDALFDPQRFPDLAAVRLKWAEVEKEQAEFVNSLTGEDLSRVGRFRNTNVKLEHLLQHVANHSTYHRGQIALMMRQLGAQPMETDFHVFLVEGRQGVPTD
jgi:uncharacterized damage-inducible protein DinB